MITGSKTSVDTSSTEIIVESERRGFILHNPSTSETLWCKLGETAVVGEGFAVPPGTSVAMTYDGEFNLPPSTFASYSKAVNGIYETETNDVAYQTV